MPQPATEACHAMLCCSVLCHVMPPQARARGGHDEPFSQPAAYTLNRPHPCSGGRLWLGGPAGRCFYSLHGHFSAVLLHPNPAVMSHCTPCPAPARLHACTHTLMSHSVEHPGGDGSSLLGGPRAACSPPLAVHRFLPHAFKRACPCKCAEDQRELDVRGGARGPGALGHCQGGHVLQCATGKLMLSWPVWRRPEAVGRALASANVKPLLVGWCP